MIYFIHIPKTAGSTFDEILSKQYGKQHILDLNNVDIDMEFKNETHKPKIASELSTKDILLAASGHFRYGLHHLVDKDEPAQYVAFFRNSENQFLSQYYYCLHLDAYPDVKKQFEATGDLKGFLHSDLVYYSVNMQTYFLTDTPGRKAFMENQEAMLKEAVNHLESSFLFCGIVERFDESLIIMKELLGWKKYPLYIKKKVNKKRQGAKNHDETVMQKIYEMNKHDNKLYKEAYSKFLEARAKIKYIKTKVLFFRIINTIYNLINIRHK